ncbi:MAG: hypothetical protein ACRDKW_00925 [Actinomycetota bacterium]
MACTSDRNGVPDSASRRRAASKAVRTASPHARSSAAWCSSSKTTKALAARPRRTAADDATCWYVVTTPCMSGGRTPSAAAHREVQVEGQGGPGPLGLEVRRREHHDQPAPGLVGGGGSERLPRGRQGERGLAGPRRGDRQEVGAPGRGERLERGLLPGAGG